MPTFAMPVEGYMSEPVHAIGPDARLRDAEAKLHCEGISALPVIDGQGRPLGMITRSDLLRVGRRDAGTRHGAALLSVPDRRVEELMHPGVISVAPEAPVSEACGLMRKHHVHRVVVVRDGAAVGIFSTRDAMLAIRDKRLTAPLHAFMHTPVFTVRTTEPISLATDRLAKARVSGLVVLEDAWPVGVFTQVEALEAKDLTSSTPIEQAMSSRFLTLSADTRLFRAADQALALRARRVLAVHGPRVEGLLSGLDFAAAAT